jgi:glycogen debranching enzyme
MNKFPATLMDKRHVSMPLIIMASLLWSCSTTPSIPTLEDKFTGQPSLAGSPDYLASPFVTAGDRVYLIGYQDGSFPDLGWHITGEMGGVWDHPIKLMDGFSITLKQSNDSIQLNRAQQFINYPFGNQHRFDWKEKGITIDRFQFVPDSHEGVIIELVFSNNENQSQQLLMSFTGHVDLRPTWLGERTNMINHPDTSWWNQPLNAIIAKDKQNPWFVMFGSDEQNGDANSSTNTNSIHYSLTLPAREKRSMRFAIAGSYQSEESVRNTYQTLLKNPEKLLDQKIIGMQALKAQSDLIVDDPVVQTMFEWLKYNTDWLIRDVPEIGQGLSAGLPDYPWWFGCDNTYAQQGVLSIGLHDVTRQTLEVLMKLSDQANGNGRIIHEASTNGAVFNPGNVNETPHFISLLADYYRWTGDHAFIQQVYPRVMKGIDWLEQQDSDHNGFPNGAGMMEIHGLDTEMIDVVVYTQQAYENAAYLASVMNDYVNSTRYANRAKELKKRIQSEWWVEQAQSFADFIATPRQASKLVEDALVRADTLQKPWSVTELKSQHERLKQDRSLSPKGHVVYHNWVVNTPMETGIATPDQAKLALVQARNYVNPFGMYVTGIDRTEGPDSIVLESRKKTFSYVGAVMTLPTGVQAIAEARYGNSDQALDYIHRLGQSFSYALPGSLYEVSPDFGMITQAWNIYAVAVPIVRYFIGIHPDAGNKQVIIRPELPEGWKDVTLNNIRVGNNSVSVSYKKQGQQKTISISQIRDNWSLQLEIKPSQKVLVNGKSLEASRLQNGRMVISLSGKSNVIEIMR